MFAFTGKGNVSEGAREIFELLPHKWIRSEELDEIKSMKGPHDCVYGILVEQGDMVKLKSETMEEHLARKVRLGARMGNLMCGANPFAIRFAHLIADP